LSGLSLEKQFGPTSDNDYVVLDKNPNTANLKYNTPLRLSSSLSGRVDGEGLTPFSPIYISRVVFINKFKTP